MKEIYITKYVVCSAHHCPMASQCHRYKNYNEGLESELVMQMLNDKLVEINDKGCDYLLITRTVDAAYGFTRMYASVPRGMAVSIWKSFPIRVSRRQFYRILDGEVPILPEEQELVLRFFKSRGADITLGFDRHGMVTV